MTDDPVMVRAQCRCGAISKEFLTRRGTNEPCCAPCYDQSWEGHGAEWEAMCRAQERGDDDDQFAPDPYDDSDRYYGDDD